MGREFPPDFTFIGDQLCQGTVSFKGHAKEPKPCAVGSCLHYLFGLCCLVLMTLLVKNTIKWLIGWCAVKYQLMLISHFYFIYQHGSELEQKSTHFKMFVFFPLGVCIFKPLCICSRVILWSLSLFLHYLNNFSFLLLDNVLSFSQVIFMYILYITFLHALFSWA